MPARRPTTDDGCWLVETHDKFDESHYFLSRMCTEYHHPRRFRWNLNAFLQSLRSVTFYLQKEMAEAPGFPEHYAVEQEDMRKDLLLKTLAEQRNYVVHEGTLTANSRAIIGVFDGRTLKERIHELGANPRLSSEQLLERYTPYLIGSFVDQSHSTVGKQLGVTRKWTIPDFGPVEVVFSCDAAWSRIGGVVARCHTVFGWKSSIPPEHGHADKGWEVLLESDVDPTLPKKWGWE